MHLKGELKNNKSNWQSVFIKINSSKFHLSPLWR